MNSGEFFQFSPYLWKRNISSVKNGTISQTIQMVFFDLESVALRLDLMSSRKPIRLIFIYLLCMVRYTINGKMGPSGLFYSFVVTLRSYRSHLRSFRGHLRVFREQFHPSLLISTNFKNSDEDLRWAFECDKIDTFEFCLGRLNF